MDVCALIRHFIRKMTNRFFIIIIIIFTFFLSSVYLVAFGRY